MPPLPIQHLDHDATKSSGFVSSTKPPTKRKAAASGAFSHLRLKEWSIGVGIPSREATSKVANLVWEAGLLKVRYANISLTPFELQVKKGSLVSVKYVDIKVRPLPAWQDKILRVSAENSYDGSSHPNMSFRIGLCANSLAIQVQAWYDSVFFYL